MAFYKSKYRINPLPICVSAELCTNDLLYGLIYDSIIVQNNFARTHTHTPNQFNALPTYARSVVRIDICACAFCIRFGHVSCAFSEYRSVVYMVNKFFKNHVTVTAEVITVGLELSTTNLVLKPLQGMPPDAGMSCSSR